MNFRNVKKGLAFVVVIFLFQTISYSQPLRKMTFVDYEHVIADLQASDSPGELIYTYDYVAVLLLDSSKIEFFLQKGFRDLEVFRNYAQGLSQQDQTVGFVTKIKDIKELFKDSNSLERILECTHSIESPDIAMIEFDSPIYVRGNEAVFEISGPTWSDTYFARLTNGVCQINWLGGIVE